MENAGSDAADGKFNVEIISTLLGLTGDKTTWFSQSLSHGGEVGRVGVGDVGWGWVWGCGVGVGVQMRASSYI